MYRLGVDRVIEGYTCFILYIMIPWWEICLRSFALGLKGDGGKKT
jgi:hypothetical protein